MLHDRMDMLYSFDNYVRNTIGDEDILDYWLTYGVPDGADDDIIREIAEDDEQWLETVNAFAHCCRYANII